MIKGVKPRSHLKLDLFLFVLLLVVGISTLIEHLFLPEGTHLEFMLQRIHGWSGVLMFVTVSLHLLLHIPWIRSQLARAFR
jgi:hypothetical protein